MNDAVLSAGLKPLELIELIPSPEEELRDTSSR